MSPLSAIKDAWGTHSRVLSEVNELCRCGRFMVAAQVVLAGRSVLVGGHETVILPALYMVAA